MFITKDLIYEFGLKEELFYLTHQIDELIYEYGIEKVLQSFVVNISDNPDYSDFIKALSIAIDKLPK